MNRTSEDSIRAAKEFVEDVELPAPPRPTRGRVFESAEQTALTGQRDQSMVVGSDIVSFVSGIPAELRQDIANCSLLAQLAANRKVSAREDIRAWYDVYFDTLTKLGWVVQERGFSQHREQGDDFQAHKAILAVATTVFGPAATALAVVQSTLDAMKQMADGPWLTLFQRESQAANAARFQVTVADPGATGGATISLMAFELDALSQLTQVLFFKFRSSDVTLRHASGLVTIDADLLASIRTVVSGKVAAFTRDFVNFLVV